MIVAVISAIVFLMTMLMVVIKTPALDISVSQAVENFSNNSSGFLSLLGNHIGIVLGGITLLILLILYSNRRKKELIALPVALLLGYVVSILLKFIVQRSRPASAMINETGYSFPSNHVVFASILFIMVIYFFVKEMKTEISKRALISFSTIMILFVGSLRIYLNVHWVTDILGGIALGAFITSLVVLHLEK